MTHTFYYLEDNDQHQFRRLILNPFDEKLNNKKQEHRIFLYLITLYSIINNSLFSPSFVVIFNYVSPFVYSTLRVGVTDAFHTD